MKNIKKTDNGFKIVDTSKVSTSRVKTSQIVSVKFAIDADSLKLSHKWQKSDFHTANAWKELNDSQRYNRICSHWAESLDLKLTSKERKDNFESFWSFVDKQISALNVVVETFNSVNPIELRKRYFSRTESLCKMLYPSFLNNQSVNIVSLIKELEKVA